MAKINIWGDNFRESISDPQIIADIEAIMCHISHIKYIEKTEKDEDKLGTDYIVTLETSGKGSSNVGNKINVDVKYRKKGAKDYWKYGEPELALETKSVLECDKTGWTLDTSKMTEYVLYRFAEDNHTYFVPAQLLRVVFQENFSEWSSKYDKRKQNSFDEETGRRWHSEALFVPASVVINAVTERMVGQ